MILAKSAVESPRRFIVDFAPGIDRLGIPIDLSISVAIVYPDGMRTEGAIRHDVGARLVAGNLGHMSPWANMSPAA